MVDFDSLYDAMISTRKNKRRSQDSIEFEIHWEKKLLCLLDKINTRSVTPSAYTFVTEENSREIFACGFDMRIIHHYIDIRLRPLLEEELTEFTYNNRVGYGPVEAIKQVEENIRKVSRNYTRDAYVIQWDIKGYFPNAIQDIVFEQLTDLVQRKYDQPDKEDLLYLIQISVYSYPTHRCYRKSPSYYWDDIPEYKSLFSKPDGIGGAIGHLIWQNAMNYYLNDPDHWIVDDLGLNYVRFVDDSVVVVENKEAALSFLMPQVRERMSQVGVTLHPKKFYCQHYSKGVKFIGTVIKPGRTYLNNRIVWHAFNKVNELNKYAKGSAAESCVASLNSYTGLLKNSSGYNIIRKLYRTLDPRWFNYIHMDWDRLCFNANPGYGHIENLCKNYGLKLKTANYKEKGNKSHGKTNTRSST